MQEQADMKRLLTAMYCACALTATGLAAPAGQVADKSAGDLKPITVTGCVSNKDGRILVTEVLLTGDLKRDVSTSTKGDMKPASYSLTGTDMTVHTGHKVEITGRLDPTTATRDKSKGDTETMGVPDLHGTITVTAVRMISTSCP